MYGLGFGDLGPIPGGSRVVVADYKQIMSVPITYLQALLSVDGFGLRL